MTAFSSFLLFFFFISFFSLFFFFYVIGPTLGFARGKEKKNGKSRGIESLTR